eukprot:622026-Amphidinium_carterae.1
MRLFRSLLDALVQDLYQMSFNSVQEGDRIVHNFISWHHIYNSSLRLLCIFKMRIKAFVLKADLNHILVLLILDLKRTVELVAIEGVANNISLIAFKH